MFFRILSIMQAERFADWDHGDFPSRATVAFDRTGFGCHREFRSSISLVAFSGLAAFVFAAEYNSFDRTHLSWSDAPGVTGAVFSVRPLSLPAFHDALMSCDRAMSVPLAALQREIARAATADACSDLSCSAIALMPTHGFAHFIAAQAAFHRNDQRGAQSHLEKSVDFARFEGWLAERRLALVVYQMPGNALLAAPSNRYARALANGFGFSLLLAVTFSTSFVDQLMSFLLYMILLTAAAVPALRIGETEPKSLPGSSDQGVNAII